MLRPLHIQAPDDLSAFAAFWGRPGFTAGTVAAHRPDGHLVALDRDRGITARCSLWWRSAPPLPGHRPGVIGHYAAVSTAAGTALLAAACRDLASQGCTLALGPMDGSTWRSYRLVTRSSARPAFFLEPDSPPDWAGHFEDSGFQPLASYFSAQTGCLGDPAPIAPDHSWQMRRYSIRLRPLELEDFAGEVRRIFQLSLESFKDNLLFSPITEDEFVSMYRPLRPCLVPGLSWVAEHRKRSIGFVFAFPDILQAQRGEPMDTVILKTLAVAPDFRGIGLGHALLAICQQSAHGLGYRHVIHALIRKGNVSEKLSAHYARPIRSYTLFARKLV
ncbi:MAG: GNAT family N-acetyltransferase [Hyphomicrobiales bacterium]